MGLFDIFKKKKAAETKAAETKAAEPKAADTKAAAPEYLDDITYIRAMKQISAAPWYQYDVLLAARGYGWEMMLDWADYMAQADLKQISQVTAGALGMQERDLTGSYMDSGKMCTRMPELKTEMGMLSVAGLSQTLGAPMKIVWINQTQVLRFFTLVNNEELMKKYAETVVRRTFGTENQMKLGKPIPEGQ